MSICCKRGHYFWIFYLLFSAPWPRNKNLLFFSTCLVSSLVEIWFCCVSGIISTWILWHLRLYLGATFYYQVPRPLWNLFISFSFVYFVDVEEIFIIFLFNYLICCKGGHLSHLLLDLLLLVFLELLQPLLQLLFLSVVLFFYLWIYNCFQVSEKNFWNLTDALLRNQSFSFLKVF